MGTRSDIIVHLADGGWARIYCHWDGYLDHNGRILFDHYTSQTKIEQLIALGDISSLAPEIGKKHAFDCPRGGTDNPAYAKYAADKKAWVTAYKRDRGETGTEARSGTTLFEVWPEQDTWTEFTYVWADVEIGEKPRDPCWWVADPDKGTQDLVNLGDALQGKITVRPSVKAFGMILGTHNALNPAAPEHSWTSEKKPGVKKTPLDIKAAADRAQARSGRT